MIENDAVAIRDNVRGWICSKNLAGFRNAACRKQRFRLGHAISASS
jgi:hypothetical protein